MNYKVKYLWFLPFQHSEYKNKTYVQSNKIREFDYLIIDWLNNIFRIILYLKIKKKDTYNDYVRVFQWKIGF